MLEGALEVADTFEWIAAHLEAEEIYLVRETDVYRLRRKVVMADVIGQAFGPSTPPIASTLD